MPAPRGQLHVANPNVPFSPGKLASALPVAVYSNDLEAVACRKFEFECVRSLARSPASPNSTRIGIFIVTLAAALHLAFLRVATPIRARRLERFMVPKIENAGDTQISPPPRFNQPSGLQRASITPRVQRRRRPSASPSAALVARPPQPQASPGWAAKRTASGPKHKSSSLSGLGRSGSIHTQLALSVSLYPWRQSFKDSSIHALRNLRQSEAAVSQSGSLGRRIIESTHVFGANVLRIATMTPAARNTMLEIQPEAANMKSWYRNPGL